MHKDRAIVSKYMTPIRIGKVSDQQTLLQVSVHMSEL